MKFEDISRMWEEDAKLDISELSRVTQDIPILHNKYFKIFSQERYRYRTMELEMKSLRLAKFEFYSQGPSPETPSHWKLPPIGKVLKSDVPQYIDTDEDIIKLNLKMYAQSEKVDYLEAIIKQIVNRGYQVKSIIDWEKFKVGA